MKHNYLKHLFTALLLLCCSIANAHDFEVDGIFYNITDATNKTVAVTYSGISYDVIADEYIGSVVIPESVTYNNVTYNVTSIGDNAFRSCANLTGITIPNCVSGIGDFAFYGCKGLTSVTIPNSVTTIGSYTFIGTAWLNNQPDGVIYAGKVLYKYKGTKPENTNISIKEGTSGIADNAFSGCSGLTSITIPNSVTSIGDGAFAYCSGLTSVSIPNSVTSIGMNAFSGCEGLTSIEIPNSVTSIELSVFDGCSGLTSVSIPNSVTSIGQFAFNGCTGLTSIEIPNSVTSIEFSAFYNCSGLTSVTSYATTVPELQKNAFSGISSSAVLRYPAGSDYSSWSSYFASTEEFTPLCYNVISESDKTAEIVAATDKYTGNIVIPSVIDGYTITSIGDRAFHGCTDLTSITIPNSVITIADQAFEYCTNLQSITIPSSVTSLGYRAFENCSTLQTVNLSDGLISIGVCAFQYCVKLQSIVIPSSVMTVSNYAFRDCTMLEKVTFYSKTAPSAGDAVFNGISSSAVLRYPAGSDYSSWSSYFASTEEFATTIGGSCGTDVNWTYADGVLTISGSGAMDDFTSDNLQPWKEYCESITTVLIQDGVTSIGNSAFYNCINLTSLTIGNDVKTIGELAFCNTKLTNVVIPDCVATVGSMAFQTCSELYSATIGSGVTYIGADAFRGCYEIETLVIDKNNSTYDSRENCNAIVETTTSTLLFGSKNTIIPDGIITIGANAFICCATLTDVVIPSSVTSIGDGVFMGCAGLTSVTSYATTAPELGENAFSGISSSAVLRYPAGSDYSSWSSYFASTEEFSAVTGITLSASEVELCINMTQQLTVTVVPEDALNNAVIWSSSNEDIATVNENGVITAVAAGDAIITATANDGSGVSATCSISVNNLLYINNEYYRITDEVNKYVEVTYWNLPKEYSSNTIPSQITHNNITYSVTGIGDYAFSRCEGLEYFTIPDFITYIGYAAFAGCNNLTNITIPSSVTTIGEHAFEESALTSVTIPGSVTAIGEHTFDRCLMLSHVTIGDGVTSIGGAAFFYCISLTDVEIPNSVTTIYDSTFAGCSGLTSIEIPSSATTIGNNAFRCCTGLKSVTSYATTAPELGDDAFSEISSAVLRYPAGSDYSSWEPYFASTEVFGAVTGITLSSSEAELKAGETFTLTATIAPEDAFVKSVTWSSSNEAVATVDQNGVVTAVAAGDAIITATANDGSEVSATCNVTVAEEQSGDDDEVVTYDNTIYAIDTEAKTGTQIYMSICMDNVVDITSFQFDLYLPEGITVVKDEDDYHVMELSERATSRHTYESGDMADGAVRVICYSTKNTVFSGNTGEVLSIPVNVSSDLADGEYEILVKEIELSTPAEVAYNVPVMASKISVFSYITGDVNGDDKISVTDITGLVNLILEGAGYTANRAADVNEDGKISVTDITGIVNLILNSTNSTASAAPAQRTLRATRANSNTMQIAPFAISAGEEKEVYVLMDNPGDAFCGFQFNIYLPDGVELLSDEYGYLVDLGSRTTNRKHVVECAEQADGSILVLCYSSKNSTFSYESGDVLVLPVKAADDLEAGVYELVMTDIEMVRPDESNEFPADYFASVVAGDGGATELVLDGYFTADAMSEISNALTAKSDIVSVDITSAVYVDSEGSLTTGNSNTLVLLPSGESIANERNMVVDGFCKNLQLTDKMPFNAPTEFTAVNASYSRSFAAPTTATFVLPVAVPTAAVNGKVYKLSGYEGDLIKFSRVTEESLEANVPYVVVVEAAGELLNSTLTNAEVVATPEDISVESGEIKHVGAYRTQEVVSGAETYYGYSGGMFVKANNGTLYPFRTMIAASGDAAFSNSYRTDFGEGTTGIDSVGAEEDDAIYFDLQGRRVKRTENGVYIINGKKTFIK